MASSSSSRVGEASGPKHTALGESEVKEKAFTTFQLGFYEESIEHFKNLNGMHNPTNLGPGNAEDNTNSLKATWNLRLAERAEELARTYLGTEDQAKLTEYMKYVAEKTVDTSCDYESLEHLISRKVPRNEQETVEIADLTICMGRLALENKNLKVALEKFKIAKELLKQVPHDHASYWRCLDSVDNMIFQIGTSIRDHIEDVLEKAMEVEETFNTLHRYVANLERT